MYIALTFAFAVALEPPRLPVKLPRQIQFPIPTPRQLEPVRQQASIIAPTAGGSLRESGSNTSSFGTGAFPLGATMVSADPNGNLSIEAVASETVPHTATRQVQVQDLDGQVQYRTEQYTTTTTVFKVIRRSLPPDARVYRNGRELTFDERRAIRQRTPIFVSMIGSPNTPPGQGYEAVFGNALVAFIPSSGIGIPGMESPPTAPRGGASQVRGVAEASPAEKEVVDKVNEARKAAGLQPLKIDATLVKAARQHTDNMAKAGRLEHVLDGRGPHERLTELGMRATFAGENVGQGQRSGAEAMETWMSSQGHRGNILNPNFTHIGVAKADGTNGPYWTQVFARIEQQQ